MQTIAEIPCTVPSWAKNRSELEWNAAKTCSDTRACSLHHHWKTWQWKSLEINVCIPAYLTGVPMHKFPVCSGHQSFSPICSCHAVLSACNCHQFYSWKKTGIQTDTCVVCSQWCYSQPKKPYTSECITTTLCSYSRMLLTIEGNGVLTCHTAWEKHESTVLSGVARQEETNAVWLLQRTGKPVTLK